MISFIRNGQNKEVLWDGRQISGFLGGWTLLLSPVTSTTGYCLCFGSFPSFFLELFLYWSPVACWAPTDPGNSSFNILSFCLFILFMWFSRQEYWSDLPFPSPVDHILLGLLCTKVFVWFTLHQTIPASAQEGWVLLCHLWGGSQFHTQFSESL